MARKRTESPLQDGADPFAPGVYLTDGSSLFNIVGELPHEPSLRLVEDCSTLEILMVHIDGLRAPGVRRIAVEGASDLPNEDDADMLISERVSAHKPRTAARAHH